MPAISSLSSFSTASDTPILIPHALPDCISPGDVGCGRGCGTAFLRRQGSEIHSTHSVRRMRRQCAFDTTLTPSGQKRWFRNFKYSNVMSAGTKPSAQSKRSFATFATRQPPRPVARNRHRPTDATARRASETIESLPPLSSDKRRAIGFARVGAARFISYARRNQSYIS